MVWESLCFCFGPTDGWDGDGGEQALEPQLEGFWGSISGTHSTPRPLILGPLHT